MGTEERRLALIINTAAYDRVAFALNVASAAAASGQRVSLLFGYGGLLRLKRGCTDQLGEETDRWAREQLQAGLAKGTLSPISQILETLLKLGGRLYACPAAMALHNLARSELLDEVNHVCSLAEFLSQEVGADSTMLYV